MMRNKRHHRYARLANYAQLQKERSLLAKRIEENEYYLEAQGEALANGVNKILSFWPIVLTAYHCFRYIQKRKRR